MTATSKLLEAIFLTVGKPNKRSRRFKTAKRSQLCDVQGRYVFILFGFYGKRSLRVLVLDVQKRHMQIENVSVVIGLI